MIAKKIKSSRTKSKAASVRDLADYIRAPEQQNSGEKVLHSGGRGFIGSSHAAQREEMVALAAEAVRSKNPVNHYVVSWREGEQPSRQQIEQAVDILLDEFGLQGHQVIYGLHQDTDNIHLHLAINRVHPETLKCVEINKGFDIEAAHRAIARIEHAQGWQRERGARYQVLENGELGREHRDSEKPRQPGQRKRDMENRIGEKSAERIAIEDGAPIVRRAQSWAQLHRELAERGMRYEKKGSGAVILVGDVPVKASSAGREASMGSLRKRLGEYRPSPPQQRVAQVQAQPVEPDVPGWGDYIVGRRAHQAQKLADKLEQDRRQEQERRALQERQRMRRDELLQGRWKGRGDALNALRSVIAAQHAAEKAALLERQRQEREQHRLRFRPYPDLEQWQRMRAAPELAEQWRHRASEPQRIEGEDGRSDSDEPPMPRDIRAYRPEIVGRQVHYTRKEEAGRAGGVSFVDRGASIDVYDWRDRDATLAALQLSAQKWDGGFIVKGCDEYKAMCARLAAEHGFRITNAELQQGIQQERQRLLQEREQAMKSKQVQLFEQYAQAVDAERYRVTSIRMREDGSKQTFILDKHAGVTRGFTPREIEQRTPEMQRLQQRGENIYYTPLSEHKHHILVDDMDRDRLARLIADGYRPAVVLESSPGNFQAVITVPKLGTVHDKDVGNRIAERLNAEYGDPRLSGAIHPHRAPGYENRKPERRREDGSYPEVRLRRAERRECAKTLALCSEIDAEYREREALKARQQSERVSGRAQSALESVAASGSAIDAYWLHYRDVLKRQRGADSDLSRVDSMIAVRMRVTGRGQDEIEGAIRQCAPTVRASDEGRNWTDYAQRTARFAFSAAGDRRAAELGKYEQQWRRLEGRRQFEPHERQPAERGRSPGMAR